MVVGGSVTGTVSGGTVEVEVVVGGVDAVVNAHAGTISQYASSIFHASI